MAGTAVKKKPAFKEKAKETGRKVKEKVKETGRKVKEKAKDTARKAKAYATKYRDDIDLSYCTGYQRGFEDALTIPNRVGTALAAGAGYRDGVANGNKKEQIEKKYEKSKAKAKKK